MAHAGLQFDPHAARFAAVPLRSYALRCQACSARFEDDGLVLKCPGEHAPALLTSVYSNPRFYRDFRSDGIYRYKNWLPIVRMLSGSGRTVTYRSHKLATVIGVANLWIAFNGYWPEKGAFLRTATFKELEAYSVLSRVPELDGRILVLASAGNTAAAFAIACSRNRIPCLIVIPASALNRMQFEGELERCVKIVCLDEPADYSDAIELADRISRHKEFLPEGGVKNIGRRDGIGTTLLNATETIGQIPSFYFQAVGSGTGGIAAFEAARRLICDGQFGQGYPRLMLSQNAPFAPMYETWNSGSRELAEIDAQSSKEQIRAIVAGVLSNRKPCFSTVGGVYDALRQTRGEMLAAENSEALAAADLFEQCEGIDIDPAAGVALASLIRMAQAGRFAPDDIVLLHVTGGGWRRHCADHKLIPARPALRVAGDECHSDAALAKALNLFG